MINQIPKIQIVILVVGTVYTLFWLLIFFMYQKEEKLFENLSEKEYPFKEIYFVGYGFLKFINYRYSSQKAVKLKKEIALIYDMKYADYYLRVIQAQRVTCASLLIALAFVVYAGTLEPAAFVVMLLMAGVVYYYFGDAVHQKIQKRNQSMISDFSEVVSELALLINAGMTLNEAWETVAHDGNSTIYQEMMRAVEQINNGMSEIDAYTEFGSRSMLVEARKFTSTIVQGIAKGNSELGKMLQEQSSDMWKQKKQSADQTAKMASTKLMIPMLIMFIGILILVVVPIFSNIGM